MAVDAGLSKAACVEKQILFLEGGAVSWRGRAPAPPPRRFRPDLFPKLMAATAGLLHETQNERGCPRSRRPHRAASFGASCRASASGWTRRERFLSLWRELGESLGMSLASRFDRVDASLRSSSPRAADRLTGRCRRARWSRRTRVSTPSSRNRRRGAGRLRVRRTIAPSARLRRAALAKEKTGSNARVSAPGWPRDRSPTTIAGAGGADVRAHELPARLRRDGAAAGEHLLERALASTSYVELDADRGSSARRPRNRDRRRCARLVQRRVARDGSSREIGTAALGFVGDG